MVTKVLGLWLFIVGVVWTFGFVWVHLTMTSITTIIQPLPLYYTLGFAGPSVLVLGSTLLMALWHTRLGSILVLFACAMLTWQIVPDCISEIVRARQPLEAPKLYTVLFALVVFVLLTDIVAALAFLRVRKPI